MEAQDPSLNVDNTIMQITPSCNEASKRGLQPPQAAAGACIARVARSRAPPRRFDHAPPSSELSESLGGARSAQAAAPVARFTSFQ